ncbi:hypothetical protein LAJLEIBI_02951 [[Clostridium] hylemonae DSM 15053]|nr:hypothetical protein LAJLEIBI_02951 [[Clostridium] hylemonae DSM 15053]
MSFQSIEEVRARCEKEEISFWKAVQLEDAAERDVAPKILERDEAYVAGYARRSRRI